MRCAAGAQNLNAVGSVMKRCQHSIWINAILFSVPGRAVVGYRFAPPGGDATFPYWKKQNIKSGGRPPCHLVPTTPLRGSSLSHECVRALVNGGRPPRGRPGRRWRPRAGTSLILAWPIGRATVCQQLPVLCLPALIPMPALALRLAGRATASQLTCAIVTGQPQLPAGTTTPGSQRGLAMASGPCSVTKDRVRRAMAHHLLPQDHVPPGRHWENCRCPVRAFLAARAVHFLAPPPVAPVAGSIHYRGRSLRTLRLLSNT